MAIKHHSVEDEQTTTEKCDSVVPNIQTFVEETHRDEDDIRRSNSPDSTEDHKKAKNSSQKKNSRHLLQVQEETGHCFTFFTSRAAAESNGGVSALS